MQKLILQKRILYIVFIIAIGITIPMLLVRADDERTAFGSEAYQWNLNVDSPIGIYAHATQGIQSVEIDVQYDATMLAYVSGGELIEPGHVRINENVGGQIQYQEMLHFQPLVSGETQISIEESTIIDSRRETHTTGRIHVPVHIELPTNWQLTQLQVNGVAITDFLQTTLLYDIEVESTAERLEIETFPSDLEVEVSKNTLDTGNNIINVVVGNNAGEQVRYILEILRATPTTEDLTATEEGTFEAQVMMQGNHSDDIARRNQILTYVFLVILVLILARLITMKLRMAKTSKASNGRKNKKESDIHILEWSEDAKEDANAIDGEIIENSNKEDRKDTVIEVSHVVMDFKREKDEATSIKEHVIRTLKRQHSYEMFRALDDISFRIKAGEVVGIIGTNGSGKSTILKIISGVLAPTHGHVKVDTSKVQLLTLGTGFDMELTGRENVYLNGALIGYTKEYIDERYEEIVAFAELEGFMEEKVRNYSSGMVSRLGFAIATARNTPEILILDEVLSVGDMFFRKKSIKRIMEMIHGGSTVLIVSHSPGTIRENCTKAVWIEQSKLKAIGEPKDVCRAYEQLHSN